MAACDNVAEPARPDSVAPWDVAHPGVDLAGITMRRLRADEVVDGLQRPFLPLVLEPERDVSIDVWLALIAANAREITGALRRFGAVLLRSPRLTRAAEFKAATAALGLAGGNYPYFTDNYRESIIPGVVNASSTPPSYPVPPHTEQAFNRIRPGIVGFVCLEPPQLGGETPLHDCVAAYQALAPKIRSLLDRSYFCKDTRNMSDAAVLSNFSTHDRAEIERICDAFQVPYTWTDGKLSIRTKGPCVVRHPDTGERAFSCFWSVASLYYFFRMFAHVPGADKLASRIAQWSPLGPLQLALRRFHPYFRTDYVYSFETDGARCAFPSSIELDLNEAIWGHTTMFRWRRGDVLVIDNIKVAHSRMPFVPPRQIGTAVFEYYDSMALDSCESVSEKDAPRHEAGRTGDVTAFH